MRERAGLRAALILALIVAVWQRPGVTAPPPHFALLAGSALAIGSGVLLALRPLAAAALVELALALGLALLASLSAVGTLDPFLSQVSLVAYLSALGILAASILSVGDSRRSQRTTSHVLVGLINLVSLYAIVRGPGAGRWLTATFTNADCFSVYPMVGALLALGLLPRCRSGEQVYLGLSSLLQIGVTFWTGSRAGVLGLVTGLLVGVALLVSKRRSGAPLLVVALLALALVGALGIGLGGSETLHKWRLLAGGRDQAGINERLDVVRAVPAMVAEHPWLGSGPGTFHLVYQSHHPARRGDYMNVAHNDYVQVLVELGPAGLLLWMGLLGNALLAAAASARKQSAEHAAAGAAVIGVATFSIANFALPVPADLYLLYGVLGLCVAGRPPMPKAGLSRALALALIAAGLVGATLVVPVMRSNQALAAARSGEDTLEWETALKALDPVREVPDTRVQLARARLNQKLFQLNHERQPLENARTELQRARQTSPLNIDLMLEMARVLELLGDQPGAEQLLREALPETPHTEAVRVRLARNLLFQNRPEDAADVLARLEYRSNPQALGELLLLIEQRQAGQGVERLRGYLDSGPRKPLLEAARTAGELALSRKQPTLARQFLALAGDDRSARLAMTRLESDPASRLKQLEALLDAPDEDDVRIQALQLWTAELLKRGEARQAVSRLESELSRHSESVAVRLLLAEAYQKESRLSEAIRVLEDGYVYDTDQSLRRARAALPASGAEPYP